ncbi:MAG TPA: hypothetical protein VEN78_14480, partial [Bradyrhizobium sp.]|nr:hypothetical protein [Bradyrhizobium sp.]
MLGRIKLPNVPLWIKQSHVPESKRETLKPEGGRFLQPTIRRTIEDKVLSTVELIQPRRIRPFEESDFLSRLFVNADARMIQTLGICKSPSVVRNLQYIAELDLLRNRRGSTMSGFGIPNRVPPRVLPLVFPMEATVLAAAPN